MTYQIREKLIANHIEQGKSARALDLYPVARVEVSGSRAQWLLTELDPRRNEAFGLCDLGFGFPTFAYVKIDDMESNYAAFGMPVRIDPTFEAQMPISEYGKQAVTKRQLVHSAQAARRVR